MVLPFWTHASKHTQTYLYIMCKHIFHNKTGILFVCSRMYAYWYTHHGSCFVKTVHPVSVKYLWIKLRQSINTQAAPNYDLTLINYGPWFLKTNSYKKNTLHFPQTAHLKTAAHRMQNSYKQDVHLHYWCLTVACCLKTGLTPKIHICFVLSY